MSELESKQDYYNEIEQTAEITFVEWQKYGEDQPLTEAIFEAVDSHQWLIYNGYHFDIIKFSNTELEYTDWKAFVDWNNYTWRDITQAMAFACFESDLWNSVDDLRKE